MLSVGILTCTLDTTFAEMTWKCIKSFQPQADELIVVESAGEYTWDADVLVKYKKSCGYTKGVNTIFRVAKGDYVLFTSNDTELLEGNLKDLCIPNTVTSPRIFPSHTSGLSGVAFCMPRNLIESFGVLDEHMVMQWSDNEFAERLVKAGIPIKSVDTVFFSHAVDQTVHLFKDMAKNDKTYYDGLAK